MGERSLPPTGVNVKHRVLGIFSPGKMKLKDITPRFDERAGLLYSPGYINRGPMATDIKPPVMNLFVGVLNPCLRDLTWEIKGVQGLESNRDLISAQLSERGF
eukprot:178436-Pleurochrysis_carterae.AAC.1